MEFITMVAPTSESMQTEVRKGWELCQEVLGRGYKARWQPNNIFHSSQTPDILLVPKYLGEGDITATILNSQEVPRSCGSSLGVPNR